MTCLGSDYCSLLTQTPKIDQLWDIKHDKTLLTPRYVTFNQTADLQAPDRRTWSRLSQAQLLSNVGAADRGASPSPSAASAEVGQDAASAPLGPDKTRSAHPESSWT